ncbi:hypothetical protein EG329_004289 [Mollisiaceae sp. DMI_Dod_QoI]|nr:hypothetical protein EG329_004289 [Helotiales sp. DMI_Dod_QoI]
MSLDKATEEALRLHNEARDEITESPRPHLKWDTTLAADAQQYANKLAQQNSGLVHSSSSSRKRSGEVCGENLAMSSGSLSLAAGTRMWIEEKYNYKGEKMGSGRDSMWGHYTEIIWPECTRVGIASARSRSGATYIVARYDKCQLDGRLPYDGTQGNIFKNRKWQPIRGASSSGGGGNRPQGQGQMPGFGNGSSSPRSRFQIRQTHRHPHGQGAGGSSNQMSDLLSGMMQNMNPQGQRQQQQTGSVRNQGGMQMHALKPADLMKMFQDLQNQHGGRR